MANAEERIIQKMEQIEFWHEIEKGSKHFVKVVKTDDVLQILADYVIMPKKELKTNLELLGKDFEPAFKVVDMEKWRELLKLRKNRPKIQTDEGFDGMMRVFYDRTEVAKWFKKFNEVTEEEKLKDLNK